MSAPATKAFSPLPIIIIAFTDVSESKLLNALLNSAIVSEFKAFNWFGRFMVKTAILSSFSIKIGSSPSILVALT